MLVLEAHPGEVETFEDFCRRPGPAIALDGYVQGATRWDTGRMHVNFNHHEDTPSSRTFVRATCEQVALALQGGLPVPDGGLSVHVNDADPDVCLSVWLLAHPERAGEIEVDRLVRAEGLLDTTAGCCPPPAEDGYLDRLCWMFEPWATRREAGTVAQSADSILATIAEVSSRIDAHLSGQGGALRKEDDYVVIDRRGPFLAVVEQSPWARARMHIDGIEAFVALREEATDRGTTRRSVTLCKMSPFVEVDLLACYDDLNARDRVEGCDRWGGSDTVGGSPRQRGTSLALSEILETVAARAGHFAPETISYDEFAAEVHV